jgi:sialic acid synthase SpsE
MSTLIIAEAGTAHAKDIKTAKLLVDAAKRAKADCVKFQWVYADEILHPKTGFVSLPTGNIALYECFKNLEVTPSFFKEIADYVHSKGLLFACSPFGKRSFTELCSIKPDIIKIASPELNHFELLSLASSSNFPVILSSGVSLLKDIEKSLCYFEHRLNTVSLLHCVTNYPAPEEDYNIRLLKNLHCIFGVKVGISDHSKDPILVPSLSVLNGGSIIEKHITLNPEGASLDDPVALTEQQFLQMTEFVRFAETSPEEAYDSLLQTYGNNKVSLVMGTGIKKLASSERMHYKRTNRSIHYMTNLPKGHVLTKTDIAVLRTEKVLTPGESPEYLQLFTGSVLQKDVASGEGAKFEHIVEKK